MSEGEEDNLVPPGSPPPMKLAGGPVKTTEQLFGEAVDQHSRRLLAIARGIVGYRASPEDIVQQALLNLYQHRARYDWHEAGGLMRRAVVNEALRVLRSPKMGVVADDTPEVSRDGSASATPPEELVERETVQRVRDAIERLPEHFRSALVLCEYERMSYQDIADTLGASVPQVKTWIHRGRRQLAEMLKGYMGATPKGTRPRVKRGDAEQQERVSVPGEAEQAEDQEPQT